MLDSLKVCILNSGFNLLERLLHVVDGVRAALVPQRQHRAALVGDDPVPERHLVGDVAALGSAVILRREVHKHLLRVPVEERAQVCVQIKVEPGVLLALAIDRTRPAGKLDSSFSVEFKVSMLSWDELDFYLVEWKW